MELLISSLPELQASMGAVFAYAGKRRKWLLYGGLGAGKTTFVQCFCRHLLVSANVTSPTFSLVNGYFYTDATGREATIHHIDLYRLKDIQEALDIGIEEYLYDEQYCLIEWPQIITPLLEDDVLSINIEIIGDSVRKLLIL